MSTLNLETVELVSTLRLAPKNGSPSSADYNENERERLADAASIAGYINDVLRVLLTALPAEALAPAGKPVGLEGRTLYSDTSDTSPLFFHPLNSVPLKVADSLRLLNGMLTTFQNQLTDMGIEVASLQSHPGPPLLRPTPPPSSSPPAPTRHKKLAPATSGVEPELPFWRRTLGEGGITRKRGAG